MPQNQNETVSSVFMVVIVNRGTGGKLAELFANDGVMFQLLAFGRGTADKKILCYLGLGETGKDILYSALSYAQAKVILEKLTSDWNLNKPGKGIAFCVPMNGLDEMTAKKRLQGSAQNQGGISMDQPYQYDLIVAVTNQGYADDVMDVAKAAGAAGGTVLHARGVGLRQAEKFFGVSIQPEKDLLFLVVKKELRPGIITAISGNKGLQSDGKTIVFSLPINGTAGLPFQS